MFYVELNQQTTISCIFRVNLLTWKVNLPKLPKKEMPYCYIDDNESFCRMVGKRKRRRFLESKAGVLNISNNNMLHDEIELQLFEWRCAMITASSRRRQQIIFKLSVIQWSVIKLSELISCQLFDLSHSISCSQVYLSENQKKMQQLLSFTAQKLEVFL